MSAGPRFGDDIERGKTLEFSQSVTYPGTVDEVVAMFLSPGYQERRFGSFVVEGSSSAVVEGDRITFSGTVRPELIPSAASRFVKGDLRVSFVEEWSRDEAVARRERRVRERSSWVICSLSCIGTCWRWQCHRSVTTVPNSHV